MDAMGRYRRRGADALLRIAGLATLAVAYLAARALIALPGRHGPAGAPAVEYLLALASFVGASVGSAMAMRGARLLDRVRISERWARPSDAPILDRSATRLDAASRAATVNASSADGVRGR